MLNSMWYNANLDPWFWGSLYNGISWSNELHPYRNNIKSFSKLSLQRCTGALFLLHTKCLKTQRTRCKIRSGEILDRTRWNALYLLNWLLSTKQLSILRFGGCCMSPRKTKFCGTQPRFRWRKLSRPRGLRGWWTIGMIGIALWPKIKNM